MQQKEITVTNKLGLHARPSALLVKTANNFRSELHIIMDDVEVNGKSIMGVMTLAAARGSRLVLQADGVDEDYLLEEIAKLFESNFSED
ncbi:MAG: HPr family phosphocarrier protein [Candidatus Cloacimonetes bacterium]|nr:HPr family phosphocarrier protein [Candidatus Cloacimonadota bacterium]